MISDYPNLVKYFASKNPVHLLIFVLPLYYFFGKMMMEAELSFLAGTLSFLSGVLYWTYIEYAVHRFLYHTHFKNRWISYFLGSFHLYHHQDMSDHRVLNAGFLMIYFMAPATIAPFYLITHNLGILAAMSVGLISAYYFYEWVHYSLHYKKYETGYLNYIQKYHMHHHDKAPHKNFGNTSHLWDYVFGTYDARYKNYVMSEATEKTMITSKANQLEEVVGDYVKNRI